MVAAARAQFGAYLAHMRRQAGYLSQSAWAAALNARSDTPTLTRSEVSRWERGTRIPDAWLPTIATSIGVPVRDLARAAAAARWGWPVHGVVDQPGVLVTADPSHGDAGVLDARPSHSGEAAVSGATAGPPPRSAGEGSAIDDDWDVAWDQSGLLNLLEKWSHSMVSRRTFLVVSGLALTQPAWLALDSPVPAFNALAGEGTRVSEPLLDLIDEIVFRAQQLDDQQGSAGAGFVADQFTNVGELLRHARYDTRAGRRLAAACAQLAQTAGFMAHETGKDGQAQRWYLAGLHAAHASGDRGLSASILGLMSNQAVSLGQVDDAAQLGAAAAEAAGYAAPIVQALLTARGSLAYAASGDLTAFRQARERTLDLLNRHAENAEPAPRWAGYVTPTELDAIAGRGMVMLAARLPARQQALLSEAEALLRGRADTAPDALSQRSALRHNAWLGLAFARSGDLDHAVAAARSALTRLPTVASVRSVRLLGQLRHELAAHASHSEAVRRLVIDLPDGAIPTTRGVPLAGR